ncbi:unnamed protein product [Nesidiocoris tenuis]|uniref:Uncharacterized protein n=1 Tax=Nesidiocoris tenuis TaxID=355587 RepID=A0A6H5HMH8_9HEMI|nr:unnamed protein product [Nesidiocoris tenuis]
MYVLSSSCFKITAGHLDGHLSYAVLGIGVPRILHWPDRLFRLDGDWNQHSTSRIDAALADPDGHCCRLSGIVRGLAPLRDNLTNLRLAQIELDIEYTPASASLDMKRVDRLCHALEKKDDLMADVREHLGLRPKHTDKVPIPNMLSRFTHTRNVKRSTEKYFTTGRNIPIEFQRDVTKERNPFKGDNDADDILNTVFPETKPRPRVSPLKRPCLFNKFCDESCACQKPDSANGPHQCSLDSKDLQKRIRKSLSFIEDDDKSHDFNPILARLQVPDEPLPPCKTDVDPEYFTVIRGRPVKEKFNRQDFSKFQRTVFFDNIFAGFFKDQIWKRLEHCRLDIWQLQLTSRELDRVKSALETFANEHHSESVKMVTEQMYLGKIRDQKAEELRKCKAYVNSTKSSLYKKDDVLAASMYCRDILLKLSPTQFRSNYQSEVQKYRSQTKAITERVIYLFNDYCRYSPDSGKDHFLDELVSTFVKQILRLGPPMIHFKHKWELEMVFRKLELQCMEQMVDLNRLQEVDNEIDQIAKDVKAFFSSQISVVSRETLKYEKNSEYEQQRAVELRKSTEEVIDTSFREIVSGDAVLETIALIEDLYDEVHGQSNAKFSPCEMISQIEQELRNIDLQAEEMGYERYRRYRKIVEERMAREINEAKEAKAKHREVKLAVQHLKNIYTKPPYGPGWRKPLQRSYPERPRRARPQTVKSDRKDFKHLRIDAICAREDVEDEIADLVRTYGQQTENLQSFDEEIGKMMDVKDGTEGSSIGSQSMEAALSPLFSPLEMEDVSSTSLSIIQLGYDSEEELLQLNYDKRKSRGEIVEEPPVLYDVKSIDSIFMVTSDKAKQKGNTLKDRRHQHRKPIKPKVNPISWRIKCLEQFR